MGSKIVAVTMGDPAGIGPEIILKSLAGGELSGAKVVVIGCLLTLKRIQALAITPPSELHLINRVSEARFMPGVINVIDEPLKDPASLAPGKVQAQAGDLAYRCVKRAAELALAGEGQAISPPPVKSWPAACTAFFLNGAVAMFCTSPASASSAARFTQRYARSPA